MKTIKFLGHVYVVPDWANYITQDYLSVAVWELKPKMWEDLYRVKDGEEHGKINHVGDTLGDFAVVEELK